VTVGRRGRQVCESLQRNFARALLINPKKLADIKALLPYTGRIHRPFYAALTAGITANYENSSELFDSEWKR
jgi:hypothetical protein